MNEMREALEALDGLAVPTPTVGDAMPSTTEQIALAPEKFPEDATIVACELWRDEQVSGVRTTAIYRGWCPVGKAVAIKNGRAVGGNYIFGRWADGIPKISPCKVVKCTKCGRRELQPFAVWRAKDAARRKGVSDAELEHLGSWHIIRAFGACDCGGRWDEDVEGEVKELNDLAQNVLRAIESVERVDPFLPPTAFTVNASAANVVDDPRWEDIETALSKAGKHLHTFCKSSKGDTILYNPGSWYGWTADHMATGLFFYDRGCGITRGRTFNPRSINGL